MAKFKLNLVTLAVLGAVSYQAAAFTNVVYSGTYDTINNTDSNGILTVTAGNTAISLDGKAISAGLGNIKSNGTLILASENAVISSYGNFWVGGNIRGIDGGDLQNLTFNGGDMTLDGADCSLVVAGTYTHHSEGGYGSGYLTVSNGAKLIVGTFDADSYYSLKTADGGTATINHLKADGIIRNDTGGTLNILQTAEVGHLWNMSTLNAENATVMIGTTDEAMLPHDYDGNVIKLANDEVYVFGNGIDRDGDKVSDSVMKVGTLIVSGNAMNAETASLTVNNLSVEKTFDNLTGAQLVVNDGTASVGKFAGADGTVMLTNATLAASSSSDFGTVSANGSTISVGSGSYTLKELSGDSNTLLLTDLPNSSVAIVTKSGDLTLAANGSSNDQFASVQDAATALTQAVTIGTDSSGVNSLKIEQGVINDWLNATLNSDGTLSNIVVGKNTTLDALGSVAALTSYQWRHDMNDLTKRMGELRDSPQGVGAWARLYGSEQEHGSQHVTAKNTSIQVGADTDVGAGWKLGAAFTYTDGSSTFNNGDSDNKAYGLAAYGTWLANNGLFVDLIAKYNRMDTDFVVYGSDGSYDNNAFSVSAEFGWHYNINNLGFIEPQAELTYGVVAGDTFTLSNGAKILQDDMKSLLGRIGVRTGFYFPNHRGTLYVRASAVHDFKGEMYSTAMYGVTRNTMTTDIGGSWIEFGAGANFNLTPNSYAYVDLERTNSGEVKEKWRWNIGFRHTF